MPRDTMTQADPTSIALTLLVDGVERQLEVDPRTTADGLVHGKDLHSLHCSFIEHNAFQCGY